MELTNEAKMALSGLYEAVGGDLTGVLERLEDIETVKMFVLRFPDDPSYSLLMQSLRKNDLQSAFGAAHTLKGVSQTLGLGRLGDCSAMLCEELRRGLSPSKTLLKQLKTEYSCAIAAINDFMKDNRVVDL